MNQGNLRRIGLAGLGAIFLLGILLSIGASKYVENKIINITGNITTDFVEYTILDRISPDEIVLKNGPNHEELHKFLKSMSQIKKIKLLKIWNTKGEIVNSTESSLEGKKYPIEGELKEALEGKVEYELSTLEKAENEAERKKYQRLYEVYIPIKDSTGSQIIGVFELYWDADELYSSFEKIYYSILIVLVFGFIITYSGMYIILKRLAAIINRKDKHISKMANRLKETRLGRDKAYVGTIQSLLAALDAKDNYTAGHSLRVADYAIKIARRSNLQEINIKQIEEAALFHDIGKIAVPEQILNKPGKLDDDEFEIMKQHPEIGEHIVMASGILDSRAHIIRHHHERVDGRGYPDGISGDMIPIESQILAVADTFDALTSNRPYRKGMAVDKAILILQELKETQLNGCLVDKLIEVLTEE